MRCRCYDRGTLCVQDEAGRFMAGGVETGSSCVTLRISIAMDGVYVMWILTMLLWTREEMAESNMCWIHIISHTVKVCGASKS